jgi:hypothetical protein
VAVAIAGDSTAAVSGRQKPSGSARIREVGAMGTLHVSVLQRITPRLPVALGYWGNHILQWVSREVLPESLFALGRSVKEVSHVTVG